MTPRSIAGKDLRLEARARVALNQVAPFALLVLVLFAFALDPDRGVLDRATPGLFWVAVLFAALLAIQRAFAVEAADGVRDGLRLSGLDPAGIFLGKVAGGRRPAARARGAAAGRRGRPLRRRPGRPRRSLVPTCLAATVGLAAAGTLYGVLAAGLRVRETILPLLLLPVVAPVLIAATQAFEAGFDDRHRRGLALARPARRLRRRLPRPRPPRLRHPPGGRRDRRRTDPATSPSSCQSAPTAALGCA